MKNVLQLRIFIEGTAPLVWRTLHIPENFTLYQLHHAIQIAFDWHSNHLYEYNESGRIFGNPDLLEDSEVESDRDILITDVMKKKGDSIQYNYDFGDDWSFKITLEDSLPNDAEIKQPVCVDGEMA